MAEFWEAYKDPRWQKKRLEVMEAAGFKCEECGDTEKTLNVHHRHYRKGAKPWEYESDELVCLCEPCHESRHLLSGEVRIIAGKLNAWKMENLLGYAQGLLIQQNDEDFENDQTSFPLDPVNRGGAESGIADSYGLFRNTPSSDIAWAILESDLPLVVTHHVMNGLVVYQKKYWQIIERDDSAEDRFASDELLTATTC